MSESLKNTAVNLGPTAKRAQVHLFHFIQLHTEVGLLPPPIGGFVTIDFGS